MTRRKQAASPHQLELFAEQLDVLSGARSICVQKIEPFTCRVSARDERLSSHSKARQVTRVYVNSQRVGQFDGKGAIARHQLPLTVEGRRITLSDGHVFTVYSHELIVIESWSSGKRLDGSKWWFPNKARVLAHLVELKPWKKLSWAEAATLTEGAEVTLEYPFQWRNDQLTNGEVTFPRQRPNGQQWRQYAVPPVPEQHWGEFLRGLEGLFLQELLPFYRQVTAPRSERPVTEAAEPRAPIIGGMWNGEGCERIAIGKNVVFVVRRGGSQLYLVDNPGVGAVYTFDNYEDARDLATGVITRTQAIQRGCRRLIHAGRWEGRVSKLVRPA